MKPRIPYTKPSITDLEGRYATDTAANGWIEAIRNGRTHRVSG
jgi:perosamine synthetase